MLDITERKVMESLCKQSQERHALAKRATQDGLWDWNILTNEEYLFPPWKEIIGFQDGELPNHKSEFLGCGQKMVLQRKRYGITSR